MEASGRRVGIVMGLLVAGVVTACAPTRVHEDPILENGDRVPRASQRGEAERPAAEEERARLAERRAETEARALEGCAPGTCEAVLRRELALGMTRDQVLAATGTTEDAWQFREAGRAAVLTPRTLGDAPADAVAPVAVVRFEEGRVRSFGYLESQGVRLVDEPADAGVAGRAAGLAEMLVREGDEYAAAGDLDRALDRYDRADVLSDDPLLDYRIASVLDKQLRPIQALIQYRLFLHRLRLEEIEARGDAAAKLAEAIAQARQRVLILERQTR